MSEVRFNLGAFSHIIIDVADNFFDEDGVEQRKSSEVVTTEATERALQLQEWYDTQHPEPGPHAEQQPQQRHEPSPPGPDGDPGPQGENPNEAPHVRHAQQEGQMRERAPVQENPRYGAGSGVETKEQMLGRSWGDCPECHHPAKPSIQKYQEWETTDDNIEVPAKHFCTNERCPTKSLWRRQLFVPVGAHDSRDDGLPF